MTRLLAVLVLCASAATATAQEPDVPSNPVVIVTGEAVVRRAPDRAFVTAAVETRARNPRDAQRQNADTMAAVQERVLAAGVPRDAVRTLGYFIHQEVDVVNGRRVPREYLARNGIEIRLDAVERTGDILDILVQAGANAVSGVRFDLQDRAAAEREALRLAVADARARADAAATGAGRSIDRVLRIDDRLEAMPPRPMMRMSMAAESVAADTGTPVEPGTIEIHAQVRLTASMR
jgi:uncharacterized protein YggE